jgi:hypothetical protein
LRSASCGASQRPAGWRRALHEKTSYWQCPGRFSSGVSCPAKSPAPRGPLPSTSSQPGTRLGSRRKVVDAVEL